LAVADLAEEVAMYLAAWSSPEERGSLGISAETVEWVSISWRSDFFYRLVAGATSIDVPMVERFVKLFSLDFTTASEGDHGGDGFFPPFARFDETLLFAPALALTFTSLRNALFAFSRAEKSTFANVISHDLEPMLLDQVVAALPSNHDWIIRRNVKHRSGEIDLLIVDPVDLVALLVQAKGTLPPQGARLTERLTDRIKEGINQIKSFEGLPEDEQQKIIENACGRVILGLKVCYSLLARSCFGGVEAWQHAEEILLMTLPTLYLGVQKFVGDDGSLALSRLVATIRERTKVYLAAAAPHWKHESLELPGGSVEIPLLKYDDSVVTATQEQAWSTWRAPPSS